MNFKKRRHQKSLNKNEQKVRRGEAVKGAPLEVLFPGVQKMAIHLEFQNQEGHVLLQETREFDSSDEADLAVACPGRCGDGTMDLQGKLAAMINQRKTRSEASAKCPRPLYADSKDLCGVELRCRIDIDYLPA